METLQNTLHVGSRKYFDFDEIILLEADVNYTKIHLTSGKIFVSSTTLGKIAKRLTNNPLFFRTHKTFMVNLDYVTNHSETGIQVDHRMQISLSRRRKNNLLMLRNKD